MKSPAAGACGKCCLYRQHFLCKENMKIVRNFRTFNIYTVIHLQFELMGPETLCFQYQWVPTANLRVQTTIFNDKSAILLHPRTRWNKNLCTKDAGCTGNKITVNIIETGHEISINVCGTSKASDQPAHMHSLIRAFTSCLNSLWLLTYRLNIIWSF